MCRQPQGDPAPKSFEVLAVDGNTLVVRLPEGTRELTVADDFRFIVNGQPMSVKELKPGMKGTAAITTKTTVTPVTVTEVKSGTVVVRSNRTSSYGPPRESGVSRKGK
jgi:thiamine pyrophosphokinase